MQWLLVAALYNTTGRRGEDAGTRPQQTRGYNGNGANSGISTRMDHLSHPQEQAQQ